MRILLTGANSFCGKKIIDHFSSEKKNKLYCISRKKIKSYRRVNIKFLKLDISKKINKSLFKNLNVDLVIHTACVKMNKNYSHNKILSQNLSINKNLISILKNIKFKKIINFSSSSVYPNVDGKFDEKSLVNISNNSDYSYGISKLLLESQLNIHFHKNKILNLRIGQILGNKNDKSITSNFIKDIKKTNRIKIYGDGKRLINLIHINKLVYYISLFVKTKFFGIYNICDYTISLRQLAKCIILKYGNIQSKIEYKMKQINNPKFILVANKFFKDLKQTKSKLNHLKYEI